MTLRKNQEVVLDIVAIGTQGEGIAKFEDGTVFVPFCCVGEQVKAKINFVKGNIAHADFLHLKSKSQSRQEPFCNVFRKCGGCQLQHQKIEAQLEFKQQLVKNALKKIGKIDTEVLPTVQSAKLVAYRNKIQLPIATRNGKPVVGFFAIGSHDIVPFQECLLHGQWAKTLSDIVVKFAYEQCLSTFDEKTHTGLLRHIVARFVQGQLLVNVVVNGDALPKFATLAHMLSCAFEKVGLFVNCNKKRTNVILGEKTTHLFGIDHIDGKCLGIDFELQSDSFFQVNDEVKDEIFASVIEIVSKDDCDVIVDAFSGIGIMSGILAKSKKPVFAIEIVKSAVEDANKMKQKNNLQNLTNICGDVNVELEKLCKTLQAKKVALVLDPPRKGCDKSTIDTIMKVLPDKIVYVSCNCATLARDLGLLCEKYTVKLCQPFDMFPHSVHVETLVCLAKN